MSLKVLSDVCIGCGACDYSCPTGALTKTDTFLGLFEIDPFTCDDCGRCVDKCPETAIVADATWPVCSGRGCPLSSSRLADVECSVWQETCPECGTTLWHRGQEAWACPRCSWGMKVHCPKDTHLHDQPVPVRLR
jgi:ferredoxin